MHNNKNNGGLYSKIKMSVRTADMIILIGMLAIVLCVIMAVK